MKAELLQVGIFLLAVSFAAGQKAAPDRAPASAPATQARPANIQNVQVVSDGNDIRIEVTLSSPVKPSVIVATNPDRLVLELPDTLSDGKQKRIPAHNSAIRGVRIGLHQADPPITHLVVDLDHSAPYQLHTEGNRVTITLPGGNTSAQASTHAPPARAVSGGIIGIFRSGGSKPVPPDSNSGNSSATLTPPPSGPPINFPGDSPSPTTGATTEAKNTGSASPGSDSKPADLRTATPGTSFPGASTAPAEPQPASAVSAVQADKASSPAPAVEAAAITPPSPAEAAAQPASQPATASLTPDQTLLALQAADPSLRTVFRVKYVADGVAYLDGGSSAGLGEKMKLEVRDTDLPVAQGTVADPNDPRVVAELEVSAVADTSSVADIHSPKRPVKVGDLAYLSAADAQALIQQRTLSATRKYPAVVTFTDDDTMDEEARDEVPRPPLPSVNRARGMFGFDYMGTVSHGASSVSSTNIGAVVRTDMTRIGGTYWNLRGYWRGRISSQSATSQPTLQDLINRTYHLNLTYDNPNSRFVAGFGRLYLPYAPSLDTIDGGYFGFRPVKGTTFGIFGGSTPDPTSWSYNPDGKIGGAFVNFEGGSYDDLHYTSTSGLGLNTIKWQIQRPFVFFENSISYKRYLSIYDSLQLDSPRGTPATPAPGPGLGRNFLTIRIQPVSRFEFDVNHNYFRDVPTYDPQLLGTGLLDKYLFQGFSVGARFEVIKQVWVYTDIGQSNRTGDAKNSLNQAFGITFNRIPRLGLHADVHYSRFSSAFGSGSYRAFSVSRNMTDRLRLSILAGDESFTSSLSSGNSSRFIIGNVETSFKTHYFLQGGYTVDRGSMNYDQWMFTLGYRFDSRNGRQ